METNNFRKKVKAAVSFSGGIAPYMEYILITNKHIIAQSPLGSVVINNPMDEDIKACVYADSLLKTLNGINSDEFKMKQKDNKLIITTKKKQKFQLSTINPDNYPIQKIERTGDKVKVNYVQLKEAFGVCANAAAKDDMRTFFQCVDISFDGKKLILQGSDSSIIARTYIDAHEGDADKNIPSTLIPKVQAERILAFPESEVITIQKSGNGIFIQGSYFAMNICSESGSFPGAIPKLIKNALDKSVGEINVKRESFLQAINSISGFSIAENPKTDAKKITVNISGDSMILKASDEIHKNYAEVEFSDFVVKGNPIEDKRAWNVNYLKQVFRDCKSAEIKWLWPDKGVPMLVEDENITFLVSEIIVPQSE